MDLARRDRFQGAVVIGRGGGIDYAAAVLILVAEGRLSLEASVQGIVKAHAHADARVRNVSGIVSAYLRFYATAQEPPLLTWDSVFVFAPSLRREGPNTGL